MKKSLIKILVICNILFINLQFVTSQEQYFIDSLFKCLEKAKEDTNKVMLLNDISKKYLSNNPEKANDYAMQALKFAEKLEYKKGIANSYIILGNVNYYQSNLLNALEYYKKSLEIIEELGDKNRVSINLNNIGCLYTQQGNYPEAIEYFQKAIKIDKNLKDKSRLPNLFSNIGVIYFNQGNFDTALVYHNKSLILAKEQDNKNIISNNLINLGAVHHNLGNYHLAIAYYEKALKIKKEQGDENGFLMCLENIGILHSALSNYDKALEYYQRSLDMAEKLENKFQISHCLNSIADIYINLGKYNEAKEILKKATNISEEIGEKTNLALSFHLFGYLSLKQKKYFEALKQFQKSLKLYEELGDEDGIANCHIYIGQTNFELGDYSKATPYSLKGLKIAQEIEAKNKIKMASEILAKSYAKQKNFEKAYQYHVLFKETNDSLFTIESQEQIANIEANLELERKKTEIAEKDLEILQQQSRQNILIIGFVVMIIILSLAIILLRISQQKKMHKLKEALYMNMQKALSQQMNPHFIFNTLNSIQNYIHKNKPEESMDYLSKFADLMRKMLNYSQNYTVTLKDEIVLLEIYSQLEALRFENHFNFELDVDENIDSNTYEIPVFLLQPLVENAIKHGLEPLKGKGTIRLKIEKSNEGIKCKIEDNGIGRYNILEKTGKEKHISIASNVIQNRLSILSKYYKKKFQFSLNDLKSEAGEVIGAVSEIAIPVI